VAQRSVIVSPKAVLRLSECRCLRNRGHRWTQDTYPERIGLDDLLDCFNWSSYRLVGPERLDQRIDRTRFSDPTAAPIGHLPSASRATWRFPMRILKMYAHRIPRSLGGLFSDNESDPAPDATRYDDAVLIPGEPEARDIGSRDRIAVDFVISHHNSSPTDRVRGVRLVY